MVLEDLLGGHQPSLSPGELSFPFPNGPKERLTETLIKSKFYWRVTDTGKSVLIFSVYLIEILQMVHTSVAKTVLRKQKRDQYSRSPSGAPSQSLCSPGFPRF